MYSIDNIRPQMLFNLDLEFSFKFKSNAIDGDCFMIIDSAFHNF